MVTSTWKLALAGLALGASGCRENHDCEWLCELTNGTCFDRDVAEPPRVDDCAAFCDELDSAVEQGRTGCDAGELEALLGCECGVGSEQQQADCHSYTAYRFGWPGYCYSWATGDPVEAQYLRMTACCQP
jgi:hypothetical protein